jgi:hypothetical protein
MFSQLLSTFISGLITRITTTFNGWSHIKFYFISFLIFIFALGVLYKDTVMMVTQDLIANQIRFRECRDIIGLTDYMNNVVTRDTTVASYTIYLYQPVNNSIYKKLIISSDKLIMRSPLLQGIYLKTQPTINKELLDHDYYLADYNEFMKHPDTQFWNNFSSDTRIIYALKLDSKVIGEIWIRFDVAPTPLQLEKVLKEISPIMYNYII